MINHLPLWFACRYIRAKRQNHFISFISVVSMLGLVLGVAVLIIVLSVMNGFSQELQTRILGMVPHGTLVPEQPLQDWPAVVTALEQEPEITAAAPLVDIQGMLSFQGMVMGAMLSGIDPVHEAKLSIVDDYMVHGKLTDLVAGEFGVVLGTGIARQLGLRKGDKITVVLPEASISPAGVMPRFKRLTVKGFFQVGAEIDGLVGYLHWADAARLRRHPGTVSAIRLQFEDLFKAPVVMQTLGHADPLRTTLQDIGSFQISDWTRSQGTLFEAIRMEKTMIALLLTLIMAVAIFNIVSSLVMLVNEKRSDIAVLRTLGASPKFIRRIFMLQGLLIGIVGTLVGAILGIIIALTISDIVKWIESIFQTQLLGAYFIHYLPSKLEWQDVVWIVSSAIILSFLATIYPARRAAQIPPADTLRYED